jgi:hypothetical protein
MAAQAAELLGTVSSGWAADGTRTYAVQYAVQTTDANDQGLTARSASGIPARGTSYNCGNDSDAAAFAKTYSETLKDISGSHKYWIVTVGYDSATESENKSPRETYDYPWSRPARVSGSGSVRETQLRQHYDNPSVDTLSAVKNSVGHFFDDEFVDIADFGITIERDYRLSAWDTNTVLGFVNCVNLSTFWGAQQDYYRMMPPVWSLQYTGEGIPYINCRYEFSGSRNGWNNRRRIDDGYVYRSGGKLLRFEDDQFRAIGGKGLLDGSGNKLPDGANPVYRTVNPYLRKDFALLSIPTTFSEV